MASKTTEYGFKWEDDGIRLVIQRTFSDKKHKCVSIFTDAGVMDIYVSPSGQIKTHMKKPSGKKSYERVDRDYLNSVLDQ